MKHRFLLALFLLFAPLCAQSQQGDDSIDDSISQNPEFLVPDYEWLGRTINDPSAFNNWIYREGQELLASLS